MDVQVLGVSRLGVGFGAKKYKDMCNKQPQMKDKTIPYSQYLEAQLEALEKSDPNVMDPLPECDGYKAPACITTLKECTKKVHCEGITWAAAPNFCKIDTTTGCYTTLSPVVGGPTLDPTPTSGSGNDRSKSFECKASDHCF